MTFAFMSQVLNELQAMQEVGMDVPEKVWLMAMEPGVMSEYGHMGITECADMLCDLARVR